MVERGARNGEEYGLTQAAHSFSLNVRLDGSLVAATKAHAMDYQLVAREGCEITGHWVATYGVEDARIFWTVSPSGKRRDVGGAEEGRGGGGVPWYALLCVNRRPRANGVLGVLWRRGRSSPRDQHAYRPCRGPPSSSLILGRRNPGDHLWPLERLA